MGDEKESRATVLAAECMIRIVAVRLSQRETGTASVV
jgi:hypothetical protein